LLVTLGDRHYLDGLVVIWSLMIIRRLVDDPTHLVGDSLRQSVKELARREHLILARIKGELHPYAGAPTRTSGEWQLSDTSEKHRRVPNPLHSSNLHFRVTFVAWFTFLELSC
jgi:hypothetical protein